jgi:type I restriction enzyme S subunit
MIGELKPYPEYKESREPEVGRVPVAWDVLPLAQLGWFFKGRGGSKQDETDTGVPCIRYGDLYTQHEFFVRHARACVPFEAATKYTSIEHGDVLFAASGETIDDIGRSAVNLIEDDLRCGGDVIVFRQNGRFLPSYLGYACDARASRIQKARMGHGFTVVHIYSGEIKRLSVPIPPPDEQTAIVKYLDHVDRKINRYIRAKKKLIALLNEQKQAIIHRAVTRGLDPNVKLQPSGVEWLGDVPAHWKMRKLGSIASVFNGTTPSRTRQEYWEQGTIPWLSSGKVNDYVVSSPSELITEQAYRECSVSLVPKGSVILGLVGQGKTRGMSAILDVDACINQNLAAIVPKGGVDGRMILHLLTAFYRNVRELGRGGNQEALNCDIVSKMRLPVPPVDEQARLIELIDGQTGSIARAQVAAQREIELLTEYRTRLIADVVTGKLDVRGVAAKLPDALDEEPVEIIDDESENEGDEASEDVTSEAAE